MIKKISMKGVATYIKGADVVDLAKVNFLFGNNGSGKSTLASFLKELGQNDISDDFKNCSQIGYDPKNEEILVFNDDFIEGNFVRKDTLKGVFSLNHINKDIDEKIAKNEQLIGQFNDSKEKELKNIQDLDTTLENTSNKAINDCFEKRSIFKTFAKIKLDNAGNKKNNFWYIQNLSENLKIDTQPDLKKLNSQYKRLYEDSLLLIQVSINEKTIADIKKEENEISNCINEIIVGKEDVQLAKLINEYGLKNWVSQGKTFLSKTKNICPFCQKETIDEDFIGQLNSIFDESSQEKIEIIKNKEKVYKNLFDTLLQNVQEVCSVFNEHNIVSNLLIKLKDGVEKNERIIQEKIDTPNEKKVLSFLIETLQTDFADINNKIRSNNDVVNSLKEQKKTLINQIWIYLAFECSIIISKYKKENQRIEKAKSDSENTRDKLTSEIELLKTANTELRTQTVNTKEAVDSINQILKNTGFQGFEIKEKDSVNNISQYYLARTTNPSEADVFQKLSEGEKNFIAFLYFYQLCLGSTDLGNSSNKKKILVIDDPVSSMDSQSLFIVSTIIQNLIQRNEKSKNELVKSSISQVLILTHNLYFYKEISLNCRPICNDRMHYKIYKNSCNETVIEREKKDYKALDDYSLMWKNLLEIKKQINDDDNSQNIMVANLFRRILESYANFVGLGQDAWATVLTDDKQSPEYYLKCAFVSMINDESHKVSPLDSFYFQKIHNEKPSKLFDVFESIFSVIGLEHYRKMMEET